MKTFCNASLVLLAVALLAVPVAAQTADQLMDRFVAAWNAGDHEALARMVADDIIYFDAVNSSEGPEAVIASWRNSMTATGAMTISKIRSGTDGSTAYHTGRWHLVTQNGGLEGAHSFVFNRGTDGTWRITSAHVEDVGAPTLGRAEQDDPMLLVVNRVRADKRGQFESYVRDFWDSMQADLDEGRDRPGDRQAFEQTRVLFPAQANEDGTYTYVFLMDPYEEGADYNMLSILRHRYDEAEAQRRFARFTESLAAPTEVHVLKQSER